MRLRLAAVIIAMWPLAASAQDAAGLSLAYEATRDTYKYRFENPSRIDTTELVPHDFTQTYWADQHWIVLRASYPIGRRRLATAFGVTPSRTTRGDDFDTFFQPDGDVVVSGTTGNVSLQSLRFRQEVGLGRAAGVDWRVGYQFRRDRSRFHAGLKIVTHTRPASRTEWVTFDRETTVSHVHEIRVGASRAWRTRGWRIALATDVAPTTRARLSTKLPDKYPGEDIVFTALVLSVNPTLTVSRGTRWPVAFTLDAQRTFSYARARQFDRRALVFGVTLGWSAGT